VGSSSRKTTKRERGGGRRKNLSIQEELVALGTIITRNPGEKAGLTRRARHLISETFTKGSEASTAKWERGRVTIFPD